MTLDIIIFDLPSRFPTFHAHTHFLQSLLPSFNKRLYKTQMALCQKNPKPKWQSQGSK